MHCKKDKESLQSSLGHAKGLGSTKSGTHHWWMQRVTAILLMPLSLWFIFSVLSLPIDDYHTVLTWVQSPSVAVTLWLFSLSILYHGFLGLQVVIEDYIHCPALKITTLIGVKVGSFVLALMVSYALIIVALGG